MPPQIIFLPFNLASSTTCSTLLWNSGQILGDIQLYSKQTLIDTAFCKACHLPIAATDTHTHHAGPSGLPIEHVSTVLFSQKMFSTRAIWNLAYSHKDMSSLDEMWAHLCVCVCVCLTHQPVWGMLSVGYWMLLSHGCKLGISRKNTVCQVIPFHSNRIEQTCGREPTQYTPNSLLFKKIEYSLLLWFKSVVSDPDSAIVPSVGQTLERVGDKSLVLMRRFLTPAPYTRCVYMDRHFYHSLAT